MTTIVYHDRVFYSDQCHLVTAFPFYTETRDKLVISACNEFVYGVAGENIKSGQHPALQKELRVLLENAFAFQERNYFLASKYIPMKTSLIHQSGPILVGCKNIQLMIRGKERDECRRLYTHPSGIGTGGFLAVGMLLAGMTMDAAMEKIKQIDPYVSGECKSVRLDDLDTFTYTGAFIDEKSDDNNGG